MKIVRTELTKEEYQKANPRDEKGDLVMSEGKFWRYKAEPDCDWQKEKGISIVDYLTNNILICMGEDEESLAIPIQDFKFCPNCGSKTEIEGE